MKTKLLLLLFVVTISFGQQRTCGMQEHMNQMMFNPVLKKQYEERQAKFEVEYQKLLAQQTSRNSLLSPNVIVNIPVAIHYPSVPGTSSAALKTCLTNLAQNQVTILNNDYNGANSDMSIWTNTTSSYFPGVTTGSLQVNLQIATQNHPAGTGLTNGSVAVTFGTDFLSNADSDSTWAGYFNIVVRPIGGGTLGYAYLASSPSTGSAVIINSSAFGSGTGCTGYLPGSPYNLGRTLTHEMGHYFNLNHIWGDTNCGSDGVSDTPVHNTSNGGCPSISHLSTCTGTPRELTMNYMDYTNDVCMYMFTAGQATRQLAHLNSILTDFKPNVLNTTSYFASNFNVYPNPSNGTFSIQLKEVISDFEVEIFDVTGKVIYTQEFYQNLDVVKEINIKNEISKGVYFLNIRSLDNLVTKKIIIE